MLDKFIVGRYLSLDSFMHRLDPRTKIVLVMTFVVVIFMANNFITLALAALFVSVFVKLSKVPVKFVLKGLKPVMFLVLFTFFIHVFFTEEGEVLFNIWFLEVYSGGIVKGLFIAGRIFLIVGMTTMLTLTTTPVAITDGLESLLSPLKKIRVPVHEIALMMSISLRFIPTLLQETDTLMKAQMSRGVEFSSGSFTSRVKAIIPLLIPLFISAFKRADDLAVAMEARGYRGGVGRTKYRKLEMKQEDTIAFMMLATYLVLLLNLRG